MFDWNDQSQDGSTIWAEFTENEDHIVPYSKDAEDGSLLEYGYKNKNIHDSSLDFSVHNSCSEANYRDSNLEKLSAENGLLPASHLDIESWPDPHTLNEAIRNYNDINGQDSMASSYLGNVDVNPCLHKDTELLNGKSLLFNTIHEDINNSFAICDWGNIGDFDDLDCLLSNGPLYGNEISASGDFPCTSSEVTTNCVQSVSVHHVSVKTEQSSNIDFIHQAEKREPSIFSSQNAQLPSLQRVKVQNFKDAHQYDYKHSDPSMRPPDEVPGAMAMTAQEKIEKLRRRQQMQAMLAIQQQQQQLQLGQQDIGADMVAPLTSSLKSQIQDSCTSSNFIYKIANKSLPSDGKVSRTKSCVVGDDPSIDETIFQQLQETIRKLDIGVQLRIRDSLYRLAQGAMDRQRFYDGTSTNHTARDERSISENSRTKRESRSSTMAAAETDTNPIDRTVAYLLFHRPCEESINPPSYQMCTPSTSFGPGTDGHQYQ